MDKVLRRSYIATAVVAPATVPGHLPTGQPVSRIPVSEPDGALPADRTHRASGLGRASEAALAWPLSAAASRAVLLIEDNADHRYVYAQVLTRAGYAVYEAGTGSEGIARSRELRPDVVVVDVMLPDTDGWRVTQQLKCDPLTKDIPVLVVSVRAFPHDHARSMEVGAARHIDKPAAPYAVVDAVTSLLQPIDAPGRESVANDE